MESFSTNTPAPLPLVQAQGCPVVLLSVQYRMHPQIRSFPSRHFYKDCLEDAPSVTSTPPEPYHSHPLMRPYLVFDVARGELRRPGSASISAALPPPVQGWSLVCACMSARLTRRWPPPLVLQGRSGARAAAGR